MVKNAEELNTILGGLMA